MWSQQRTQTQKHKSHCAEQLTATQQYCYILLLEYCHCATNHQFLGYTPWSEPQFFVDPNPTGWMERSHPTGWMERSHQLGYHRL